MGKASSSPLDEIVSGDGSPGEDNSQRMKSPHEYIKAKIRYVLQQNEMIQNVIEISSVYTVFVTNHNILRKLIY